MMRVKDTNRLPWSILICRVFYTDIGSFSNTVIAVCSSRAIVLEELTKKTAKACLSLESHNMEIAVKMNGLEAVILGEKCDRFRVVPLEAHGRSASVSYGISTVIREWPTIVSKDRAE